MEHLRCSEFYLVFVLSTIIERLRRSEKDEFGGLFRIVFKKEHGGIKNHRR